MANIDPLPTKYLKKKIIRIVDAKGQLSLLKHYCFRSIF